MPEVLEAWGLHIWLQEPASLRRGRFVLPLAFYSWLIAIQSSQSRPSRTQQLLKPRKAKDGPSVDVPAEFGGSGQSVTSKTPLAIESGLAAKSYNTTGTPALATCYSSEPSSVHVDQIYSQADKT